MTLSGDWFILGGLVGAILVAVGLWAGEAVRHRRGPSKLRVTGFEEPFWHLMRCGVCALEWKSYSTDLPAGEERCPSCGTSGPRRRLMREWRASLELAGPQADMLRRGPPPASPLTQEQRASIVAGAISAEKLRGQARIEWLESLPPVERPSTRLQAVGDTTQRKVPRRPPPGGVGQPS